VYDVLTPQDTHTHISKTHRHLQDTQTSPRHTFRLDKRETQTSPRHTSRHDKRERHTSRLDNNLLPIITRLNLLPRMTCLLSTPFEKLSSTHTHIHTHTHTYLHAHTHTYTLTYTHTLTHSLSLRHTYTHTHTPSPTHTPGAQGRQTRCAGSIV